jgi:DNA-binding MurR/RpiR family transcriptional regulator
MQLDIDPSSLSDVEFHIYSYILSNIKRVTYMSIQELARETNSSTASILRFCSRANCNGYAEFKFRLRAELDSQLDRNDQPLADSLPEIRSFFETTVPSKDFNTGIQNAAELLIRKSIVIFAGLGSSDYASGYGASYFSNMFGLSYRIETIADHPVIRFPAAMADSTCVIALSVSGETEEVISYVRNFRDANCAMIAITGNQRSRLAALADVAITYSVPIAYNGETNLTTQVPAIYIIEKLGREVQNMLLAKETPGNQ